MTHAKETEMLFTLLLFSRDQMSQVQDRTTFIWGEMGSERVELSQIGHSQSHKEK